MVTSGKERCNKQWFTLRDSSMLLLINLTQHLCFWGNHGKRSLTGCCYCLDLSWAVLSHLLLPAPLLPLKKNGASVSLRWAIRTKACQITERLTFLMPPILNKRKRNKCNDNCIRGKNEWIQQECINSPMIVAIRHDHTEGKICGNATILTSVQNSVLFSFLTFSINTPFHWPLFSFHDCFLHLLCLLQDGVFVPIIAQSARKAIWF